MTALRVSAVVTAHDRREYLAAAVRSAMDAGADEVLVVRNFSDPLPGLDGRFREIRCDRAETNEKEAAGVEAARGDVVAFLDDDDVWEPTKAASLRDWFSSEPDLAYANHALRPIGADGQPVGAAHPEISRRDPRRFATWDGRDFDELVTGIWPGNNSSTVVRRAWATGWLPTFREAGWGADLFWLSVAVSSGARIRIDPTVLTRLRLHDRNMSHARGYGPDEFRQHHRTSCERFARSLGVLARVARERSGPDASPTRWLSRKAGSFGFLADLEAGRHPRRSAARLLRARVNPEDRGVAQVALISLLAPSEGRRALYRSSLRRWRLDG